MGADGSNPTRLTSNEKPDFSPSYSSDGARIALGSISVPGANPEIFVMDADGSDQVQLTAGGLGDGLDSCPTRTAATKSGCPTASRKLTFRYVKQIKSFKGRLKSSARPCRRDQRITVRKARKGPNRNVGKSTTKASGRYKLRDRRRRGRYYAEVDAVLVAGVAECAKARSRTRRVR